MQQYKCPICQCLSYNLISPYLGKSPGFLDKFIVKCTECNFLNIYPLPTEEELNRYYKSYWQRHDIEKRIPLFEAQEQARHVFLKPFLRDTNELRVMDVGASFGLFYQVISRNLLNLKIVYTAIEVDPLAVDFLKRTIKDANVYTNIRQADGKYDVIVLSHILEHLRDPKSFLLEQREKIANGGLVFIEVPNQDYIFKFLNEPHLNFFAPLTLQKLMDETDFKILRIDTCGMRFRDLINRDIKSKQFRIMKSFVKSFLPKSIVKKVKELMISKDIADNNFKYIFEYGPDRAWIRLVAIKI